MTDDTVIRIDISPDCHPLAVKGESPAAGAARDGMKELYEAHGRVNDVAGEIRDKGRLATAATQVVEQTLRRVERQATSVQRTLETLDQEIAAALRPTIDPYTATEIRTHWSARKDNAFRDLSKLIGHDPATTSAVLAAPAYLSGISDENQGLLRQLAADRMMPDKVAARKEAADGLAKLRHAAQNFSDAMAGNIAEWSDPDNETLQKLNGESR